MSSIQDIMKSSNLSKRPKTADKMGQLGTLQSNTKPSGGAANQGGDCCQVKLSSEATEKVGVAQQNRASGLSEDLLRAFQ